MVCEYSHVVEKNVSGSSQKSHCPAKWCRWSWPVSNPEYQWQQSAQDQYPAIWTSSAHPQTIVTTMQPVVQDKTGLNVSHQTFIGMGMASKMPQYKTLKVWNIAERTELKMILKQGIIKPSYSLCCSPMVCVLKIDEYTRICIYYLWVNAVTIPDSYLMPRMDDILDCLGSAQFTTTLNITSGYFQVLVADKDQLKTLFASPVGKFEYTRMPFRLKGAPAMF